MNATVSNLYPQFSKTNFSSSTLFPNFPSSNCTRTRTRTRNLNPRIKSLTDATLEQPQLSDVTRRSQFVAPRRIILLRHANSSWENTSLRDHDRPLSKSGQAEAVNISEKLKKIDWIPQLILSSDAVRTRETLQIMQKQVRLFLEAEVHFISSFYSIAAMDGQTAEHLQHAICKFAKDEILTVMCIGHNRGWEEAASMFSGSSVDLKTCNAALLETTGKSWKEAFDLAGFGGWKLHGVLVPSTGL